MRISTAHRIAPQLPCAIAAMVGTIIERTVHEEHSGLNQFECLRDSREMLRRMDLETAVAILCAEGKGASC